MRVDTYAAAAEPALVLGGVDPPLLQLVSGVKGVDPPPGVPPVHEPAISAKPHESFINLRHRYQTNHSYTIPTQVCFFEEATQLICKCNLLNKLPPRETI